MSYVVETMTNLAAQTGFAFLKPGNFIMILVALVFLYLAIAKGYEPLLLVPISFGMLLVNLYPSIMEEGGLLHYFYLLDEWSILPSLIFLGVGALTDFGPLIANPASFLLGAAAQFGIYFTNLLHGDLGNALLTGKPVMDDIVRVFPATIELATMAIVVGAGLGIPLGVLAAARRNSLSDYVVRIISLAGYSTPIFWVGMMGLLVTLPGSGNYIVASDAVNTAMNYGPPMQYPGLAYDTRGFERTIDRIRKLENRYHAQVLFSHDIDQYGTYRKAPFEWYE